MNKTNTHGCTKSTKREIDRTLEDKDLKAAEWRVGARTGTIEAAIADLDGADDEVPYLLLLHSPHTESPRPITGILNPPLSAIAIFVSTRNLSVFWLAISTEDGRCQLFWPLFLSIIQFYFIFNLLPFSSFAGIRLLVRFSFLTWTGTRGKVLDG